MSAAAMAPAAIEPLTWSEPRTTGYKSIHARDGDAKWWITPVPRDVTRVKLIPDDHRLHSMIETGYGESVDEAKIVIDVLRAGTDALPGWREQLTAANFAPTYPHADPARRIADMWQIKIGASGFFTIVVHDRADVRSVHAMYERDGDGFHHNVTQVTDFHVDNGHRIAATLPAGVDALKAGVAAALAILKARADRTRFGFGIPLGGAPK